MSGSLSTSANFVVDAFRRTPPFFYQPEDIVLGRFDFAPWVRSGLAAVIQSPSGAALRGSVDVSATLQGDDGSTASVGRTLTLRGPGDVLGIDAAQIIRRAPEPNTQNAEETFLAQIEFDRPELPWLFSPFAPAGDQVQPWIALVVCEAENAPFLPGGPGLPEQVLLPLGELPPLADAWAWAHAQVVGATDGGGPSVADRLSDDHAPANLSRLVCPRKLEPGKSYVACLVPTFDAGVQAGLGKGDGTLGPAWPAAGDPATQVVLPCYDSWSFAIGEAGDFKSLAERLVPVRAPWQIGRRLIDTTHPGGPLPTLAEGDAGAVQVLRCALVSPQAMPSGEPAEDAAWSDAQREALRTEVDRVNAPGDDDLPRVGPRLYARFQRAQRQIGAGASQQDWFVQLNSLPLQRIVAGLGTRVVQQDQEMLMQAAWAQVGDIELANQALRVHQFARYAGEALNRQHFAKLALGPLTQVLRGVQGKLRLPGAGLTVNGQVAASQVAPAAMTSAFRRMTRLRGPIVRRAGVEARGALAQMVAEGGGFRDFRRAYVEPSGVKTLSARALAAIPTAILARRLDVPEANARAALTDRLAARGATPSLADRMLAPLTEWRVPAGTTDLGALAAGQIAVIVQDATPADAAADPARSEALAGLLVGLANSGIDTVSVQAKAGAQRMNDALGFSTVTLPANAGSSGLRGLGTPAVRLSPSITLPAGPRAGGPVLNRGVVIQPQPLPRPPAAPSAAPTALQRFESDTSRQLVTELGRQRVTPNAALAQAFSELATGAGVLALPRTPARPALAVTAAQLLQGVAPALTMSAYVKGRLGGLPPWLPGDWFDNGRVEPIMAAPHFDRPMYEALDAYDRDWLIPGIGSIAQTDFVTLLETNPAFTEAFLIGLSDEMGRELLWRGYPTDQRGTYFRRFWDHDNDELASDIHLFDHNALGSHLRNDSGDAGHIVLVVRGELMRRYPHAMMAAVLAEAETDQRPVFTTVTVETLFHAHLAPDFILVGFKLTADQVRRDPWWFVIAEHPTAPRFGLELAPEPGELFSHDNASWADFGALAGGRFLSPGARTVAVPDPLSTPPSVTTWPGSAATVARTLFRNPVRAAFRASTMIDPGGAHA